jgi:beta-1,4-mannooligosaccharide/beta-1,4-mannosyl-N-acetylglucosamine phosphorylase
LRIIKVQRDVIHRYQGNPIIGIEDLPFRCSGYWDCDRVGTACPPLAIDQGWLLIYYGEKHTSAGPLLRLGAAILDRDDPSRVLARSNIPILSPRERYERIGDVGNAVFACSAIVEEDQEVQLCYGAADTSICAATCPLQALIQAGLETGSFPKLP